MNTLFYTPAGGARWLLSWCAVLLATLAVSSRLPSGVLAYQASAVLDLVVPIAGTLVALTLPAAQLAQSAMAGFLSSAQELIKSGRPIPAVAEHLGQLATERKRDLAGIRCVIVFSVCALVSGLVGILDPTPVGGTPPGGVSIQDLLAAFALSSLVAAVLWLMPVVQSSFSFAQADQLVALLRKANVTPSASGTPAKPTPVAGPVPLRTGEDGRTAAEAGERPPQDGAP